MCGCGELVWRGCLRVVCVCRQYVGQGCDLMWCVEFEEVTRARCMLSLAETVEYLSIRFCAIALVRSDKKS